MIDAVRVFWTLRRSVVWEP